MDEQLENKWREEIELLKEHRRNNCHWKGVAIKNHNEVERLKIIIISIVKDQSYIEFCNTVQSVRDDFLK